MRQIVVLAAAVVVVSCLASRASAEGTAMIGEACFPGVPVQVYFLRGHSRRFNRFYEHLLAGNYVKPFEGKLESWDYEPRNATDDIVAKILDAYHEHQIK